jgi:adenylate cyclase
MGTLQLPITGGCLCGTVRYASSQHPFRAGYCHCRHCQRALGNLFGPSVMFYHDHFQFTNGEPNWWEGPLANRGFCLSCGSPIAFQYRGTKHITIWVGSLDRPEDFRPEAHWGIESRLPWVDIHADLPGYQTEDYLAQVEAEKIEK